MTRYQIDVNFNGVKPTQEMEVPLIEETTEQPLQQTQQTQEMQTQKAGASKNLAITGGLIVGGSVFNYALQQPTRSGNSHRQDMTNATVEMGALGLLMVSSPAGFVVGAAGLIAKGIIWKKNDDFRRQQEERVRSQLIVRSGIARNGRSRT